MPLVGKEKRLRMISILDTRVLLKMLRTSDTNSTLMPIFGNVLLTIMETSLIKLYATLMVVMMSTHSYGMTMTVFSSGSFTVRPPVMEQSMSLAKLNFHHVTSLSDRRCHHGIKSLL